MVTNYTGWVKGRTLLALFGLSLVIACSHIDTQYKAERRSQGWLIAAHSDKDRDGVMDFGDLCPKTPKGSEVDGFGCHDVAGRALYSTARAGERHCGWEHYLAECRAASHKEYGNND